MPFYQTFKIKEIRLSEEKDNYYFHQNNQEVEIKLNQGFSIAKDLLNFIGNTLKENKSFEIKIVYKNEIINYFIIIEIDKKYTNNFSEKFIQNCKIISCDTPSEIKGSTSHLYGSISPFVLNNRETNFIDELVECFPKQDFSICLKTNICNHKKEKYLEDLSYAILELSKESQKSISKSDNIFKNIGKTFGGGKNISYTQKELFKIQQQEILENHYKDIESNLSLYSIPEIKIISINKKLLKDIESKFISFSQRSGTSSINNLSRKFIKLKVGNKKSSSSYFESIDEILTEIVDKKKDILTFYENISSKEFFKKSGLLSSNDITTIIALPTSEIPGIKVTKKIDFGSDISENLKEKDNLKLGYLFKNHQTNLNVMIPYDDLQKHTFVTGVTGSGKTSTIKHILMESYKKEIPFLVFEPAKREYKYLENKIEDLKVFKLGIEGQNRLSINPFSFPEKIHVQTHLDYLKSVFFAAFPLYGPMPYILEKAFYNIYKSTGWDLISSRNNFEKELDRDDLFPTLEDLYIAIQEVTDEVGYSKEVQSDIKGALKVRIGSLMTGAKGSMLNTRESYPIENLLNHPTIIEMEQIGDNDEKIFLMGLLLIRIYEYYKSKGSYTNYLKNILVLEEGPQQQYCFPGFLLLDKLFK